MVCVRLRKCRSKLHEAGQFGCCKRQRILLRTPRSMQRMSLVWPNHLGFLTMGSQVHTEESHVVWAQYTLSLSYLASILSYKDLNLEGNALRSISFQYSCRQDIHCKPRSPK